MKSRITFLLLILWLNVKGQGINEAFFNQMKNLPIDIPDLAFHYAGIDTVKGIEIKYYHRTKDICNAHLFLISDTTLTESDKQLSLQSFLIRSAYRYHYIKYANYSSFFGCEYNDVDSFLFCRNENLYSKNMKSNSGKEHFYKINDEDYFTAARVEVVVYKFISADVKYAPFFYHFMDVNKETNQIEKIIYKEVIKRDFLNCCSLFQGVATKRNIECISKYY